MSCPVVLCLFEMDRSAVGSARLMPGLCCPDVSRLHVSRYDTKYPTGFQAGQPEISDLTTIDRPVGCVKTIDRAVGCVNSIA